MNKSTQETQGVRTMKNPTLATLLNIIPGLGYIYVGRKRIFGLLILITVLLSIANAFDPVYADTPYIESGLIWELMYVATIILAIVAFMYDGYHDAVAHNNTLNEKPD